MSRDNNILAELGCPAPYTTARADASAFSRLLASVENQLNRPGSCVTYEAGVAYLALRNVAMSLSALCMPRVDFSRMSPRNLGHHLTLPFVIDDKTFETLVRSRHASQRGHEPPEISRNELVEVVSCAREWVDKVMDRVLYGPTAAI
jgi:hypothetical protein